MKKPAHGGDVWSQEVETDFSSNVNPLGPPERVKEALIGAIDDIHHYPDIDAAELKAAISKYVGTSPENITLGNGSTELIKNFCEQFARGGNVVIPIPTFSEYEYFARLNGSEVRHALLETKKIIESIDRNTSAVFLCNPNNPTGTLFDEREIETLIKAALDASALVFLDEAYIEFSESKSFADRACEFENLVVLRSLTKFFSLAGLRIGYACAAKELIDAMERARVPWNVNTLAQVAGIESLKDTKFIDTSKEFIKKEREFMSSELSKFLKVEKTHANFFLIDLDGKITSGELKGRLLKKGMLVRDCSTFAGLDDNFIRVCIRRHDENAKLIEELRREL
ncbi:threonine-phosphate decarboxylase CobD [archaeon]|nr:threonine-phosphate decarboxylase CobD [archaeon]